MTELFAEANHGWNLAQLYKDISSIKGLPLTDWEKTCLRGLLCRYSPKAIAAKIYWTDSALRTELSRRLYSYITALTKKDRVVWHKIADDLAELGYTLEKIQDDLASVSNPKIDRGVILTVSEIINTIVQLGSASKPKSNFPAVITIERQGNQLNLSKDYGAALECYHLALKTSGTVNVNILINIARCYDRLEQYSDSLAICYFALNFIDTPTKPSLDRCKIYNFVAGVFHEMAIAHRDKAYLMTAIDSYEKAVFNNVLDLLPIWNQIDLIIHFVKEGIFIQAEELEGQLDYAQQKMELLMQVSRQGDSDTKYRLQILADMRSAFTGMGMYWQQRYHDFQNIGI
jgi:tetratricopeptide (TPR) repeat protein